jgi:peptide/nickel transport system permease protein
MARYIWTRIGLALVALLGVLLFVFVAARLTGDPTYLLAGDSPTPEDIARIHAQLGLDKPIYVQFFVFLGALAHGDFGQSIHYHQSVISLLAERVPATIELVVAAFVLSQVLGIAFGVLAAINRGTVLDLALRTLAALGQSMPNFWLGLVVIMIFAVGLGWFPTSGRTNLLSLVLPAITLALYPLAATMRITRSSMLEAMGSEYVRYLQAKGIKPSLIVWKHALRNALVPITALAGSQLSFLLGGTVIVETVFAWPGLGSLMVDAVHARDYPLIQTAAILISTAVVFLNLGVDLLFGIIDPRIRYV